MANLLEGSVIISKSSGGTDDVGPIHFTIEDELSHCRVLEIWMSLEEFAKALTSSFGKAKIEYFPRAPIGMKAESKTEVVPFDDSSFYSREKVRIERALKGFEVDGWKARRDDMTNFHHRVPGGQRVAFFRYVNPDSGKPLLR